MDTLLEELTWRGMIHDVTPGLADRLAKGPITGYGGFDPTAKSLQIGNLVLVMLLAHLQRAGGTPIVLVGGGTGLIGDPSGRDAERPLLDDADVEANVARQRSQLERFLEFSGSNAAKMVNNADWLCSLGLIEFLRDIGKHFTVSLMLQKESVKRRLEAGISFTEFTYMLLQGYDFLHLYRTHGCELQLGGSDQWGNITAGTDLIRRIDGGSAHALCAPLITTSSGVKFGKTAEGAVWLDPELTSPYRFYQFWINADDRDVESYLKVLTFKSSDDIVGLLAEHHGDPGARIPHRALAQDLTERIHGVDVAGRVRTASNVFFDRLNVDIIRAASLDVWETLEAELPSWTTNRDDLPSTVVDLISAAGLTDSKGDARRQLQQGGVYINGERAHGEATVADYSLLADRYLWLRRGKKKDVIVKVTG
ncbi:MAG: tyrosine--tRNA ligase [Gemmatimonadetes bacterium]|nr:tyrosine--tRNA ligase [Gemmatimonadota bacterium]MCH8254687.1 tyrosine--tRNA ligase [Gemmatimonadota bacterium]MCH8935117.1 tyrosine--tRNA ligase [Gemmatimonadota bacterium]